MTQDHPNQSRDSTQAAGDAARELGSEAGKGVRDLRDRAVSEAAQRGEAAKDGVADEISDMGNALRRAADELRQGSPQQRSFGQMAEALADVSDTVRDKDMGEMVEDLSRFARRNPMAFLGGAALLGFAGTRIARASKRDRHRSVDLHAKGDNDDDDDDLESAIHRPADDPRIGRTQAERPATPAVQTAAKGETLP